MNISLVDVLKSKTNQAQLEIERLEKLEQARILRASKKKDRLELKAAQKEASILFDKSQPEMLRVSELGQNYYDICRVENPDGIRCRVIMERFEQAGLKVNLHSKEIPGTGSRNSDDGSWWAEYNYYIRGSW